MRITARQRRKRWAIAWSHERRGFGRKEPARHAINLNAIGI